MKTFSNLLLVALLTSFLLQISLEDGESLNSKEESASAKQQPDSGDQQQAGGAIFESDIVDCADLSTNETVHQEHIVNCHNEHRRKVDPPGGNMLRVEWDKELQKDAQEWADLCYGNHSHPEQRLYKGELCGENVVTSPECIHWTRAIQVWMDERKYLDFGKGRIDGGEMGHYCQVVTDYTGKIGCGVSKCKIDGQQKMVYVCRYFPAGNRKESLYKPYAVGEPCSMCKKYCDTSLKLCTNYCGHTDTFQNCKKASRHRKDLCHNQDKDGCKAMCLCPHRKS